MNPPGDREALKLGSLMTGLVNWELSYTGGLAGVGGVRWRGGQGVEEPGKISMRECLPTDSLLVPNNRIPLDASS